MPSAKFWKKWKWPYLLNWMEYFDKLLRKHWYWQDLAQEIAKWHFSLVEALPSSKFWKSDNGAISWTEWNIVMKFCIHIDIDKMYRMRLSNMLWDWPRRCRGSNFEKVKIALSLELSRILWWNFAYALISTICSPRDCQISFGIGRGVAEVQILKKWKWPYLLNWVEYFNEILHTQWYWHDEAHEIVKWHLGLVEVLPRFKFWKQWNLTPKPFGIFW